MSARLKNKHLTRIAFTFVITAAFFLPNFNVLAASTLGDNTAAAASVYPSTQAVKQVTFATHMANELNSKNAAQDRLARQTATRAAQLAYQKQQDEIARKAAEKAAAEKAAAEKAAAEKAAAEKAAAEKAAAEKAAAEKAAAEKAAAEKAAAAQTSYSASSTGTTTSKGTFKISFYDPAVLGSNMGYGGVAANLSIFPRGTRLKISMSNGQVLYRTVNDTGSFAYSNPYQLDVAMPNSSIPAAGILSATVSVIS
ncbi:hydrolase [Lapidilactobacillus luobeiensis]|uniref:hydrolase n=1 Tax=Lapidilactobacillus luobeiensis TaxID=2950371 RepID=UPI002852C23D|nr:hydrolase [Lapidilactobacillus luobeiensis]